MAYKNTLYDWFEYFFWELTKKWRMKRREYNTLSCNFKKLKDELIHFTFDANSLGYNRFIDLVKNDEIIKYSYKYECKEGFNLPFPEEKYNEFIKKIFIEKIHKWKKAYAAKEEMLRECDGLLWSLKMEFTNLPEFSSFAYNAFPKNWDKFNSILKEYFLHFK